MSRDSKLLIYYLLKEGDVENLIRSLVSPSSRIRVNFKEPPLNRGYFRFILINKDYSLNNLETRVINYLFHFELNSFKMMN